MSDFFKKMKSVFVESVESSESANEQKETDEKIAQSTDKDSNNNLQGLHEKPLSQAGKHSDQFYKILFDALERNNQPGFDYLEFKKALMALESISMDERTRYLSAFAGAQASGADAKILLNTANIYLEVLDTESSSFKSAVDQQWQKQIGNRENEINQLHNLIKEKTEHIHKLQAEIEEHQKLLTDLNNEIGGAQSKIETTKADFQATYDGLVQKIRGDIDRINTYIIQK